MRWIVACAVLLAAPGVRAETRSVGPGETYTKPCQAFAAAQDGDVIEIDAAGSYDGDVCAIARSRLRIRGLNGRAHIDAAGKSAGGKAIWVIQGADTQIEDIELSGCTVPDKNGAGIRQEGRNLLVRRGFFHDNENGILTGADAESWIAIEDSEFARNGAGDGQSHNMYIGEVARFTLQGSYSHHGKVGHLVKSRALRNDILYNRLTDETGDASYELDLPQGGASYVLGNLFQKSADAGNSSFISYARESKRNPSSALWVVNNTFVNQRSEGTFVSVAQDVATVVLRNNVFAGAGISSDLASAVSESNFAGDAKFTNAAQYDYALTAESPAVDHGVAPGLGAGEPLTPPCQYVHPAHAVRRVSVLAIDQGALERGSADSRACSLKLGGEPPDAGVDASVPVDAGAQDGLDARVAAPDRDASAGPARGPDPGAAPATKSDSGCQGAGAGAQLWSLVSVLTLALRRRRYAAR
ncbi:MAG TPA: hypothetical protein VFX59_13895 [Polyangiales bacterium]|nr:hypothetical protein [Polyangiales bacterium]